MQQIYSISLIQRRYEQLLNILPAGDESHAITRIAKETGLTQEQVQDAVSSTQKGN